MRARVRALDVEGRNGRAGVHQFVVAPERSAGERARELHVGPIDAPDVALEEHRSRRSARAVQDRLRPLEDGDAVVRGREDVRGGGIHAAAAAAENLLPVQQDAHARARHPPKDRVAVGASLPDDGEAGDGLQVIGAVVRGDGLARGPRVRLDHQRVGDRRGRDHDHLFLSRDGQHEIDGGVMARAHHHALVGRRLESRQRGRDLVTTRGEIAHEIASDRIRDCGPRDARVEARDLDARARHDAATLVRQDACQAPRGIDHGTGLLVQRRRAGPAGDCACRLGHNANRSATASNEDVLIERMITPHSSTNCDGVYVAIGALGMRYVVGTTYRTRQYVRTTRPGCPCVRAGRHLAAGERGVSRPLKHPRRPPCRRSPTQLRGRQRGRLRGSTGSPRPERGALRRVEGRNSPARDTPPAVRKPALVPELTCVDALHRMELREDVFVMPAEAGIQPVAALDSGRPTKMTIRVN